MCAYPWCPVVLGYRDLCLASLPSQAGTGGHTLGLLGSQECLDSPYCSHFLHFRRQDKGEKGSLAFFHMVYFYAVFQKLLQECSVGRWTRVALYWLPLTCQLRRICGYGQDHCWPGSLGSRNIISIHPPTHLPSRTCFYLPTTHVSIHPSIQASTHASISVFLPPY